MAISQQTVGQLIDQVNRHNSQASLGSELMRHGLASGDLGPGSGKSVLRRASDALNIAFEERKEQEFTSLAASLLKNKNPADPLSPWIQDLIDSLRRDGYEAVPTTRTMKTPIWGSPPAPEITWRIGPLGTPEAPLVSISSSLNGQLKSTGFAEAAGHFDQAFQSFISKNWAATNGQLRTTFESVIVQIATERTQFSGTQGGPALSELRNSGALTTGPDNYISGLWKMSHTNGSHPGLSDADEAQHRFYAITAAVSWLVRTLG